MGNKVFVKLVENDRLIDTNWVGEDQADYY